MTDDDIAKLLADFGAGRADLAVVVAALVEPYREAVRARAQRDPSDPDAGTDWSTWDGLAYAHVTGVITAEQYGEVADAVIAAAAQAE